MTKVEALRYVGHFWTAWGLRAAVLYVDVAERALRNGAGMVSTVVNAPRGKRRDQGSTPCGSTETITMQSYGTTGYKRGSTTR